MAVLLGLAECLDYTESAKIAGVDPYFDGKKAVLEITATDGPVFIELHQLEEKKPWFRKTFDMDLDIKVV